MNISLPLDSDGFLRRECPRCSREFKWHNGPANEEAEQRPSVDTYHCPLCGEPSGPDSWWTQPQLGLIENAGERLIAQEVGDMFKSLERKTRSNRYVQFKAGRSAVPDPAEPLVEPDDMTIVASPCHPWEPVKVPEDHAGTVYCLVCGAEFSL